MCQPMTHPSPWSTCRRRSQDTRCCRHCGTCRRRTLCTTRRPGLKIPHCTCSWCLLWIRQQIENLRDMTYTDSKSRPIDQQCSCLHKHCSNKDKRHQQSTIGCWLCQRHMWDNCQNCCSKLCFQRIQIGRMNWQDIHRQ